MFVNITEKPPWGSVIKAITYYLLGLSLFLWLLRGQFDWAWLTREL